MNPTQNPLTHLGSDALGTRYLLHAILGNAFVETQTIQSIKRLGAIQVLDVDGLRIAARRMLNIHDLHDPTQEHMHLFHDAVGELHRLGDVLPFRFGTLIAADALEPFVAPQKEHFLARLDQIAGCTEINVRWAIPAESGDQASHPAGLASRKPESKPMPLIHEKSQAGEKSKSGLEYLRDKRQAKIKDQYAESLAAQSATDMHQRLGADCVAVRSSVRSMKVVSPTGDGERVYSLTRVDLLVRRNAHPHMMQMAWSAPLGSAKPTLVSGPWPPFSFMESATNSAVSIEFPSRVERKHA